MIIQRVYKGIVGLQLEHVEAIFEGAGIYSNWWADAKEITPQEVIEKLAPAYVTRHLNDYDEIDPDTQQKYGARTAFISTTAGSVVRDADGGVNEIHTAEEVAAYFATDAYRRDGWVFDAYVFTLGRPAVEQAAFAEEVRELHIYTEFLPYQPEGELLAKVHIPSVQIAGAWPLKHRQAATGEYLWPDWGAYVQNLKTYVEPERLVNYRDVLS